MCDIEELKTENSSYLPFTKGDKKGIYAGVKPR